MSACDSVVLISKDALCKEYLPTYGNSYCSAKTPNIDELAQKGTVYTNFYAAAPSSAMSYIGMFTGLFAHQTEIETFRPLKGSYRGKTLFDKAKALGFNPHIFWDTKWFQSAKPYTECYGENTTFHNMDGLRQGVGAHYIHEGFLQPDEKLSLATLERFGETFENILASEAGNKTFIWIHLPHVLNGSVAYGSDINIFDSYIGLVRRHVSDDQIFITADHGNMNGHKGKLCYGFDVYDPAIRIPLITPRKEGLAVCNRNVSSVDLFDIIFSENIPQEREFIYSDSAYYVQAHRKLAIIHGKYKYIQQQNTNRGIVRY